MTPIFYLKGERKGQRHQSQLWVNGHYIGASSAKKSASCPDPEKLANLLILKKALSMTAKYAVVLPMSARAVLDLAGQLANLRYEATLDGRGGAGKLAKAQKLLEAAKHSPSRVVRAAAAALQEFLK